MKRLLVGSALSLVAVTAAFSLPSVASARKCSSGTPVRFPDAPEPVYVLDGREATEAELKELAEVARDTIESIAVVCADRVYEAYGIRGRRSAIVMFTKPGPEKRLRAALDSIASLQRAHLAAHGQFARTTAALGWSDPAGLITVEIDVADDGGRWSALGRHRHILDADFTLTVAGDRSATRSPR